jgi:pimeloyl-ACP methyl ester carboxylesterase
MPRALVNGVELDYEMFGPEQGEPLLLVMGLAMQRVAWPASLLDALIARGFRCITVDNRDVGHSTRYDDVRAPALATSIVARLFGLRPRLPYHLPDLADDAMALLTHMDIEHAHVAGISMGGMVAQHIAARHGERVRSLSLMATSTGRLGLPPPKIRVLRVMRSRPRGSVTVEQGVSYMVRLFQAIGSPAWPIAPDELERRARLGVLRAAAGTGVTRQLAAILADGDRSPMLRRLAVPTLVLHGGADPMVPIAHGIDLARAIPAARFESIEGWGHDLPDALASTFADHIANNARGAR